MRGTVKSGCKHLVNYVFTAKKFTHENSQSTDAAIGYDFLRMVVFVKSQKSGKEKSSSE